MSKRVNFTNGAKNQIKQDSLFFCQFPGCSINTFLNTGEVSHINAASPGGPRYDKTQAKSVTKSAANGIMMCKKHAHIIDADPEIFTTETLLAMKKKKMYKMQEFRKAVECKEVKRLSQSATRLRANNKALREENKRIEEEKQYIARKQAVIRKECISQKKRIEQFGKDLKFRMKMSTAATSKTHPGNNTESNCLWWFCV